MLKPVVRPIDGGRAVVSTVCRCCGTAFDTVLDAAKVRRVVEGGEHVQDVFPEMSPEVRELFFISGTCDACWDEIFKGKDK